MASDYTFYPGKKGLLSHFSVTSILIFLNVLAFLVFTILLASGVFPVDFIALKPSSIVHGMSLWTLLTSMFMHAGFAHLFFNMISLFFIGSFVERIIGRKRYLWFYIISGLVAAVFFVLPAYYFGNTLLGARIFGAPGEIGVGASGAIFGLAGLLAVLIPRKKIYLIAGPLLAIILQSILTAIYPNAPWLGVVSMFVTVYIFIAIFSMFSFNPGTRRFSIPIEMPFWILPIVAIIPLVIIGVFVPLPIGNTAHFGGLLVGVLYGLYLRKKYQRKTKYLSSYFS